MGGEAAVCLALCPGGSRPVWGGLYYCTPVRWEIKLRGGLHVLNVLGTAGQHWLLPSVGRQVWPYTLALNTNFLPAPFAGWPLVQSEFVPPTWQHGVVGKTGVRLGPGAWVRSGSLGSPQT